MKKNRPWKTTNVVHAKPLRHIYGSKAAGREKSAWNVPNSPSLKESPCPNYPSYRLGSFTQLEIYGWPTHTRIFPFLGRQETCAGNSWNFLKLQEIWIGETEILLLMTINEAYLVALIATVTLTYIPVQWWLLDSMTRFLGYLWRFLGISDGFLDQSTVKYQNIRQQKSRKWTNIPRKWLRKRVIESRIHYWDISWYNNSF